MLGVLFNPNTICNCSSRQRHITTIKRQMLSDPSSSLYSPITTSEPTLCPDAAEAS